MDPITISQLGRIRQQELLDRAARNYDEKPLREYVAALGNLMIRVGQKLVDTATPTLEPQTVPSQNPAEQCC